jgi:hypothetical protein
VHWVCKGGGRPLPSTLPATVGFGHRLAVCHLTPHLSTGTALVLPREEGPGVRVPFTGVLELDCPAALEACVVSLLQPALLPIHVWPSIDRAAVLMMSVQFCLNVYMGPSYSVFSMVTSATATRPYAVPIALLTGPRLTDVMEQSPLSLPATYPPNKMWPAGQAAGEVPCHRWWW